MGGAPPAAPLFSSETLSGRFIDLWELAERFQRSYSEKLALDVSIDEKRLYLIVISTYDDIARYKFYHLSDPYEERSDAIKRAAYTTKWITRFKPCRINGEEEASPETILVNEIFAISVAITNLNLHCAKDFWLNVNKEYELIYDLMYRGLNDDALMLFYQTIVDIVQGASIVE